MPSTDPDARRGESGQRLVLVAFLLALGLLLFWVFAPVTESVSTEPGPGGAGVEPVRESATLIEDSGPLALVVVAVPAALAAVALVAHGWRTRRRVWLAVGWLLLALCLVGAASVGLFYLPAAGLILLAGYRAPRPA